MKKFIPLLVFSLLLASCNIDDTYTQTNVQDMVNVTNGQLYDDAGYLLNVVDDQVGAANWKVEGARYLAQFDILNRNLDIALKKMMRANVVSATPYSAEEVLPQDPAQLFIHGASGGFMNLGFTYARSKTVQSPYSFTFRYELKNGMLTIYAFFEGLDLSQLQDGDDELTTESQLFSIPITELGEVYNVTLVMYCVVEGAGQKYTVEKTTMNLL